MPRGFENSRAVANDRPDSEHVIIVDVAEVNVFFDGTGNNYYNATADKSIKDKHRGEESYANDLSNVARMWFALTSGYGQKSSVYIDGIGTTRYEDDNTRGYALGSGQTGIVARVEGSFDRIMRAVRDGRRGKRDAPHLLDINVYGFSRGAAAARHFIHLANTRKRLFGGTWKDVHARIGFVGLFDTVSAYAEGIQPLKGKFDTDFGNDVTELKLAFGDGYARRVFHLAALDEYRQNFSLTTIESALQRYRYDDAGAWPMGRQLAIPGAHSDVGGGYPDHMVEARTLNRQSAVTRFIGGQGWYTGENRSPLHERDWQQGRFVTHQRRIPNEYYKVGLALMVDQAQEHANVEFRGDVLQPPVYAQVKKVWVALRDHARKTQDKDSRWSLEEHLGQDEAQAFRHQFLHCSFQTLSDGPVDQLAHGPRMENGRPQREWITG